MNTDVIIIGTGQAGVPLAERLTKAGKRVLVAERAALGGTCVNYGCTPTKTMVASARAAHVARTSGRLGVYAEDVRVDLEAVVRRKEEVVRRWSEGIERRLRAAGDRLTLARGHARFVGEREIEVNGERHRADTVVINVGARPAVPAVDGIDGVPWLDNAELMSLRELPSHLVVLGGGYIGCEFAQMFRRFGSDVTVVDKSPRLVIREDPEISEALASAFRSEGIRLELGAQIEKISGVQGAIELRLSGRSAVSGSHLLVAAGRRPNTHDLGCEAADVALSEKGYVVVDDHYRSSAPGVYAVGDAIDQPQFTHVAWDDHRILYDILLGRSERGRGGRSIPYTVFTDPQLAGVGLTEREVRERGLRYEAVTMPFGQIARAIELDETAGILKVIIDPETERILGAAIVGAEAGELIHVFVTVMQANASARAIVDAEYVHPTFAEGVQSVVMKIGRFSLDGR